MTWEPLSIRNDVTEKQAVKIVDEMDPKERDTFVRGLQNTWGVIASDFQAAFVDGVEDPEDKADLDDVEVIREAALDYFEHYGASSGGRRADPTVLEKWRDLHYNVKFRLAELAFPGPKEKRS